MRHIREDDKPYKGHARHKANAQLWWCDAEVEQMDECPYAPIRLHAIQPLRGVTLQPIHGTPTQHSVLKSIIQWQADQRFVAQYFGSRFF